MTSPKEGLEKISILKMQLPYAQAACDTVRLAFGVTLEEDCDDCMKPVDIAGQLERFPEGQFVALIEDKGATRVAGFAATMRTHYPPTYPPRNWMNTLGDKSISRHEPNGEWLYGVEMAVNPAYQGHGIGTKLYQARFALVQELGLKGWYAVGMLMGYHRYRDSMTIKAYGEKVIARELHDPTVTMQMNRGFEAWSVVEDYLHEPPAGNGGVLIVWKNPNFK